MTALAPGETERLHPVTLALIRQLANLDGKLRLLLDADQLDITLFVSHGATNKAAEIRVQMR